METPLAPNQYLASSSSSLLIYEVHSQTVLCQLSDNNKPSQTPTASKKIQCFSFSEDSKQLKQADALYRPYKYKSFDKNEIYQFINQGLFIDQIIAFCEEASNKLFFSRALAGDASQLGSFIKSYTIVEESVHITCLTFNNDSSKVAYGCTDGSTGILNLKTKKKDAIDNNHKHRVVGISYNNNDSLLASASVDGSICITNQSGKGATHKLCELNCIITVIWTPEPLMIQGSSLDGRITCLSFSVVKSNVLGAGYESGKIIIWDAQTGYFIYKRSPSSPQPMPQLAPVQPSLRQTIFCFAPVARMAASSSLTQSHKGM